jgi:HEAT repeat protein
MRPWIGSALVSGISAIVLVLPIVLGLVIARAARRRQRWNDVQRVRHMRKVLAGFVRNHVGARRLFEEVQRSDAASFWSALESTTARMPRRSHGRLSQPLIHNRHSARERRVLLNDSPWRQELAARRLGLLRSPRSRRALRSALAAGPELVSFAALCALAGDRDLTTLEWLLAHPDVLHRRSAKTRVSVLCRFGRRGLTRIAAELERGIEDPKLLHAVIEVLGIARYSRVAAFAQAALTHSDVEVRVAAARALGRMNTGPSANALIEALSDPAWQVRAQAARSLGELSVQEAVVPLVRAMSDRGWWVRRHSAYALAKLGDRGRLALRHAAEHSDDRYAREMAEEALFVLSKSA